VVKVTASLFLSSSPFSTSLAISNPLFSRELRDDIACPNARLQKMAA
jgi:hypothetical protein